MLDRKSAPPFQKSLSFSIPKPHRVVLSSGVPLFLLDGVLQNVVRVEAIFNAGKWFEKKIGQSHFFTALLEKGTSKKNATQIAEILDNHGASFEAHAGSDFISISLYSLRSHLHSVLPLFLEILQSPTFPEKEWNLSKDIFLQNLKVNREKTSYMASVLIRKNIFGENHPYGSSVEEQHVSELDIADFHHFFSEAFNLHSLFVVGNFEDAEVDFLKSAFQELKTSSHIKMAHTLHAKNNLVDRAEKAGSVQSTIRLGKRTILKTDPRYTDLLVYNHLLGGFFGSRLMKNIREEKGLTYGIYSSVSTFVHDGLFIIGADVNKANLELANREIRLEIEKLRTQPVSESELELARNHFLGSLQADMANLFSVMEKSKNIHLFGLPGDYYEQLFNHVGQITPDAIQHVAEKYFGGEQFFEVAYG
jgi:zinc protease